MKLVGECAEFQLVCEYIVYTNVICAEFQLVCEYMINIHRLIEILHTPAHSGALS